MINHVLSCAMKISKLMSRKGLYSWIRDAVKDLPSSRDIKVLNVGASGAIPDLLNEIGAFHFESLDINPDKKPDIICDASDMKGVVADNSYDVIFIMEVLEHIPTPHLALGEMRRILKPGGKIFGSTPFIFPIHDAPHDYYRYTVYGLKHLLADYQNVKIKPRNSFGEAIAVLISRMAVTGSVGQRGLGVLGLIFAISIYPLLFVLGKFCNQNLGPTGYVWSATKQ